MEVKPGYKQTEVGVIPEEWHKSTLKNAAEISAGINKPISEMGHGALYVTVQDLYSGTSIRTERIGRIRVSSTELQAKALEAGDIVFGKSSVKRDGIGYPSQFLGCAEPVVFSGFTYRARARHEIVNARFLFYVLRSNPTRRWLIDNSQASALTNINQRIADAIPVTLPPLPEQRAIATALSDVDELLSGLDRLIAKKRDLKQAAMQQLLTGQTRLPGFHGEWDLKILGTIATKLPKTTRLSSDGKSEGRFPFFTNTTQPVDKFLDDKDFDQEVIIANTGGVAYFDYYNGPFAAMSDCLVLTVHVNAKWLFYLLKLMESSINNAGFTGSGIKHLDKGYFFDLAIRTPKTREEQASIASFLTDMDSEIKVLEARRDKTNMLKQGMMQELLTGRIRLVEAEALHA
jgi:type I restriction enzyme S subunit